MYRKIVELLIDESILTQTDKSIAHFYCKKKTIFMIRQAVNEGKLTYTSQVAITRLYKTYREFLATLIIEKHDYFKT